MIDTLRDATPATVIAALEANWREYRRAWGRDSAVAIRDDEQFFWFATGLPHGWLNAILRVNVAPTAVDTAIDQAVTYFAQRALPWLWIVGPTSTPANLPERLQARGFHLASQIPTMSLELPDTEIAITLPPRLAIKPVGDATTLAQWGHVLTDDDGDDPAIATRKMAIQQASVGHPGKHDYIGLRDGVPVATATLMLASGVAGLYAIRTIAAARRQGIGAAMTLMVLREAQRHGYHIATLQASPLGFPVYQRLGFTLCRQLGIYAPPGSTATGHP